jgi:hypothetical protein
MPEMIRIHLRVPKKRRCMTLSHSQVCSTLGITQLQEKRRLCLQLGPRRGLPTSWKLEIFLLSSLRYENVTHMEISRSFVTQQGQQSGVVSLDVRADGHMQILSITNYDEEISVYKPKKRGAELARQESISSSSEGFEAVAPEAPPGLTFDLELAGIGLSLINRKMIEVVYITIDTLKFQYTDSSIAHAVTLSCGVLQIDNQLHDAIYPVILQPTPIVKQSTNVAALPTVQSSIIWLKDQCENDLILLFLPDIFISSSRSLLYQILLHPAPSSHHRGGRRPAICSL